MHRDFICCTAYFLTPGFICAPDFNFLPLNNFFIQRWTSILQRLQEELTPSLFAVAQPLVEREARSSIA
jgi:hypothetical protein